MENLGELLSKLEPVVSGDGLLDVLTAERINAMQDSIRGLAAGDNLQTGIGTGIAKESGPGWVKILALPAPPVVAPDPGHPFKARILSVKTDSATPPAFESFRIKVDLGRVFKIEEVGTGETIVDMDQEFTVKANELVWLEVYFTKATGNITGLSLRGGDPASNGWSTYNALYNTTSPTANTWFHPICKVRDITTGEVPDFADKKLEQFTFTDLVGKQHKNFDDTTVWGLTPYPVGGKTSTGATSALSVWEENSSGLVSDEVTILNFIGLRTKAVTGATAGGVGAGTVDVKIGTIQIDEDGSRRAEAVKKINFKGAVKITSEQAPGPGDETGDGEIDVEFTGGGDGYGETVIVATVYDPMTGNITAKKLKIFAYDDGVFTGT